MTQPFSNIAWTKFASSIHGQTSQKVASSYNYDNVFTIQTLTEKIELIWADQPERGRGVIVNTKTLFSYKLASTTKSQLKIWKKDFFGQILTLFNRSKIKLGNPDIDKEYLFFSADKDLIHKVSNNFKSFTKTNLHKDFTIYTEVIEDEQFLIVQVNNLLTEEKTMTQFYIFGQSICKALNSGV